MSPDDIVLCKQQHCDMICWDSLLKRKYCTRGGHCCTENGGRVCRGLAMKWSPPCFCAPGCDHKVPLVWGFITSFISWFTPSYKITNVPPGQARERTVTATEARFIRINGSRGGDAKLPCCVMGFLKGSARLGWLAEMWQQGPSTVTMVTLAHHAGKSLQ